MALSTEQLNDCILAIFEDELDVSNKDHLAIGATAFHNLAMHYIERNVPHLLEHAKIDNTKVGLMLQRFHRDAYGVSHFLDMLSNVEKGGMISAKGRGIVEKNLERLSIRINTARPRKTRIVAAFSLWMATFRPITLIAPPSVPDNRHRLDATINFWIATRYLERFGEIRIGDPENDPDDFDTRLNRIWYDLTYRDISLSSLEFLYAFIFIPRNDS